MRRLASLLCGLFLILVLVAVACAPTPGGQTAAEFYKGKTVKMVVPYNPGGATDMVARLIATFWSEFTDGTMQIENITGGGTLTGTNYVARAEADGLTVGLTTGSLIRFSLFKQPGIEYDARELTYVVLIAPGVPQVVAVGANVPYNSLEDLKGVQDLTFGVTGPVTTQAIMAAITIEVEGFKDAKIVTGYKRASDVGIAACKGEVVCQINTGEIITEAVRKGFVKPIVALSSERNPFFPDIPTLLEVTKLSPKEKELFEAALFIGSFSSDKIMFLPSGVPEDRVRFLRDALYRIATDKTFIEQLKLIRPEWQQYLGEPVKGEDLAKGVNDVWARGEKHIPELDELVKKYLAIE